MSKTYVIDKNESRVPFFGDKMSFITGLDPLGLQNPSVKTYSHLMPGLNNVTGQIRCYSFYCWLLNEYSRKIKSTDPNEQKKFVRKAEYIIALLSQLGDIPGISGKQYASKQVDNKDDFDLNIGTYNSDGTTIGTYWQYGFGIFGQYYVGSMRQIGIIDEPTNEKGEFLGIYRKSIPTTDLIVSGEDLANAFEENIHEETKELFLSCIEKAIVSKSELKTLMDDFNLRDVKLKSPEWSLLLNMLLSNDEPNLKSDEPSTLRKQTLFHLLDFTQNNPQLISDREFTMFAYENSGSINGDIDVCLLGWYYYQFNEYWQVACTAILDGFLMRLESESGPGWLPLSDLISDCINVIISTLDEDEKVDLSETLIPDDINISYTERELSSSVIRGSDYQKLTYGFLLILKVCASNRNNLDMLEEYVNLNGLKTKYDGLGFYKQFCKINAVPLESFIKDFLHRNIVDRHQLVAYRKMGGGSQSTQKFIIEDGLIRHIGYFNPFFTGPRVGNLISFLKDLRLLTEEGVITAEGKDLLKNRNNK